MGIKLSDLSGHFRDAADAGASKKNAPVKARRGVMNKWEKSFAETVLETWKSTGKIGDYQFEAIKLRVGIGAWYTPDFAVNASTLTDVFDTFYEVKGRRTEASIVRLKVAALLFPKYRFVLVTRGRGSGWEYTKIGGDSE